MLSRLVIAFLPRSKRLLISWLIIRSLQLHTVHSKTSHCQLAALMWWYLDAGLPCWQMLMSMQIYICVALKAAEHLYLWTFSGRKGKKEKPKKKRPWRQQNVKWGIWCKSDHACLMGKPADWAQDGLDRPVSLEPRTMNKSGRCTCGFLIRLCNSAVAAFITGLSMPLKSWNREAMQRVHMQGTDGKLQALRSACDPPRPRAWPGFHVCLFPSRGHVISVHLEAVRGPDWSCCMVHTRLAHSKETPWTCFTCNKTCQN